MTTARPARPATTSTASSSASAGRWAPEQVDSTYVRYNAAEHTPDRLDTFFQRKLVFSHSLSRSTFYSVKLSQQHFFNDVRVQGKNEWEYEGGAAVQYNDMRYFQVTRPFLQNAQGEIGSERTNYHYYNPEGSFYLQDRWEHEGMVMNIGVRYDLFNLGDQVTLSETKDHSKAQLSPRVGIAYPISDRNVFSFHYGRFYQIPDRRYIFDNRDTWDVGIRGNPNLTNEPTISYQAGIQHLFSEILIGQFSVYYKDIFGLITTESVPDYSSTTPVRMWVNRDYASARGFECTLLKRFSHWLRYEVSYTYGRATGTASDPDAAVARNFLYLPTSEQPLNGDVRHSVSATLYLADPGSWGINLVWNYSSGFPYTPMDLNTRRADPELENSRRLPSTTTLDIQAEKYYRIWG